MMSGMRTYSQNCGLARSLDLLGERWTMLIVRELARGPKRFGELTESLGGIGTNLLAARLRALQESGVITQERLPAPAGVWAYALTDSGRRLTPLLEDLALWGLELPWPAKEDAASRSVWVAMTMRAHMERAGGDPPDGVYEFNVDGEQFWLHVSAGSSQLLDGRAPIEPDVRISGERNAFLALARGGELLASERDGEGQLCVEGDGERLRRLTRTFRFPARVHGQTSGLPAHHH